MRLPLRSGPASPDLSGTIFFPILDADGWEVARLILPPDTGPKRARALAKLLVDYMSKGASQDTP